MGSFWSRLHSYPDECNSNLSDKDITGIDTLWDTKTEDYLVIESSEPIDSLIKRIRKKHTLPVSSVYKAYLVQIQRKVEIQASFHRLHPRSLFHILSLHLLLHTGP